jgi:hypothetical protein
LFSKLTTLNNNFKSLPLNNTGKDILHRARETRNEIAHGLAIGITGCLDIKFKSLHIKSDAKAMILLVAKSEYLISSLLSIDPPTMRYGRVYAACK